MTSENKEKQQVRSSKVVKVIEIIETIVLAGKGTPENPAYLERSYWTMDGELLTIIRPDD